MKRVLKLIYIFVISLVSFLLACGTSKAAYSALHELDYTHYTYGSVANCQLLVGVSSSNLTRYTKNVMASFGTLTFCGISENAGSDYFNKYNYWYESVTCKEEGFEPFSLEFISDGLTYKGFGCRKERSAKEITCTKQNANVYSEVQVETNNSDYTCTITKGSDIAHFSDSSKCIVYFNGVGEVEVRVTNKNTGVARCVSFNSKDTLYEDVITPPDIKNCKSLLGDPTKKGDPSYYIVFAFKVVRYVAIILLIVLSVVDLVGAVASSDSEILNKTVAKIFKRFILCIIIFLLPMLLQFILHFINENYTICGVGE